MIDVLFVENSEGEGLAEEIAEKNRIVEGENVNECCRMLFTVGSAAVSRTSLAVPSCYAGGPCVT